MKILVAGGAGYIGSHMVRALLKHGIRTAVFDNLSTGYRDFIPKKALFIRGDLRDAQDVRRAFERSRFDAVMHFAASSLVGESVADPHKYYENNVAAFLVLARAMGRNGVKRFIFSSTAAVYGEPKRVPIRESDPTLPVNPYGASKLMVERILEDLAQAGMMSSIRLRYFNACGASEAGSIGERHRPETHLIPNILRTASGRQRELVIYGDDYPTRDGTCVRDYIHVDDLARAHLSALGALRDEAKQARSDVFNLGNGSGYSILEIVKAAERVTGRPVRRRFSRRRPGDPARLVASAAKAARGLGWKPRLGLEDIIRSAWKWEMREAAR